MNIILTLLSYVTGYRTYLTAIVFIAHRLLAAYGVDIPNEQLSAAIDAVLGILVIIFRAKAQPTPVVVAGVRG